jgi:hypothetical protein
MDRDRKTGTLTLQIVGTHTTPPQQQSLRIMMTGVLVRIKPAPADAGASEDHLPERTGTSGADGLTVFNDLPAGHYDVFAGP